MSVSILTPSQIIAAFEARTNGHSAFTGAGASWAPATGLNGSDRSLLYHEQGPAGKIATALTKPLGDQDTLALAYSPHVVAPVHAIAANPLDAYRYTSKGNTVAVVSNGTGILGVGDLGPHAFIPVGEGKVALFKIFGGVDGVVWSLATKDPEEIIRTVTLMAPVIGGVNLEDIAAPDCFYIEKRLKETLDIPVFHDDQHGTSTVAVAALMNALDVQEKDISRMKVVFCGAGAAGIAIARLLLHVGFRRDQIFMSDSQGVIFTGRDGLDPKSDKASFAQDTSARTFTDILKGADLVFTVGKSGMPELSDAELASLGSKPIIFALENPDPRVNYQRARALRPDSVVCTGRSDFPNQANNVLGFPFLFRGALDVWARDINPAMQIAAARVLAAVARETVPDEIKKAYGGADLRFGPESLIPKPFDRRLFYTVPVAVAEAAMTTGVARRPYASREDYQYSLLQRLADLPPLG